MKCDLNDDFDEIEIEQCHVETLQNWWYGCLGDYCGATLPEGVCAEKCIPPLEEGIALCDGKISNDFLASTHFGPSRSDPSGHSLFEICADSDLFLDALANGEINQIEHYKCVMGPGGPGPTWEQCTAECICDQPSVSYTHLTLPTNREV